MLMGEDDTHKGSKDSRTRSGELKMWEEKSEMKRKSVKEDMRIK